MVNQYPQLFVARTFSKAAGLAGLRLGAVIACAESLTILRRATAPFPVNVAALAAAEAAVGDPKTMKLYVKNILRTRGWFEKELHKLNVKDLSQRRKFPPGRFRSRRLRTLRTTAETEGVLLRDRAKDIGPGLVRVSIGTQKEMERLLKLIKRYR